MCDHQEKNYKHGKTVLHHHHNQDHYQQKLYQTDENYSQDTHSKADGSILNEHQPDHGCPCNKMHQCQSHHYQHKPNRHRASLPETTLISSTGSFSSSSSSFSSSSSSCSSFSSSSSSSSSSFSSDTSSECWVRSHRKPQHSQSCTNITGKHKYFDGDDDTVPLIDKKGVKRCSVKGKREKGKSPHSPTQGTLNNTLKIRTGSRSDGNVWKSKSMEALSRPNDREEDENYDKNEQERRKSDARKNLMKEKMKFSAFLNEITRQVLSPMRLTTLGVTDSQRPCSPQQASVMSNKMDNSTNKRRQQRSRPTSADSVSSSQCSHTSKQQSTQLSKSRSFHHSHTHHSEDSPSHMYHRTKSCTDISCLKRAQTPQPHNCTSLHRGHHCHQGDHTSHHHCHHHCEDWNCLNNQNHHRDQDSTNHLHHQRCRRFNHQGEHHSLTNRLGNHQKTLKHNRVYHSPSHYHHNKDHRYRSHFSPSLHHEQHCHHHGNHHGPSCHHHHGHQSSPYHYEGQTSPPHHHHHGHQSSPYHCEGHTSPPHHHLHGSGYYHHESSHPKTKCLTTSHGRRHHSSSSDHGNHHSPTHLHHPRDQHNPPHHHHHGDYYDLTQHHSFGHHLGDHHNEGHHYHRCDSESHQHHHGNHQNPGHHHHHHHGDHRNEFHHHHKEDHHMEKDEHHHGDHCSLGHQHHGHCQSAMNEHHHGDRHKESHPHFHDEHSRSHLHHHGSHQSDAHPRHHSDYPNDSHPHHHGDHHNESHPHHHGDHHNESRPHHPGNHPSESHPHHRGDHKSDSDLHRYGDDYNICHHQGHHPETHVNQSHSDSKDFDQVNHYDLHTHAHSPPSHRKSATVSPSNTRSHVEEQTSFLDLSSYKERTEELGRITTSHDKESLGEAFMSNQNYLEAELQKTRMELSDLTEKIKRLHDSCSSTPQTNDLLHKNFHSLAQSMEGERERLNRHISALKEQLADAKSANSVETETHFNVTSALHNTNIHYRSDDAIQVVLPITPPPTQFMDSHDYGKAKSSGQEQSLGSVPEEEEESDWSEMAEEIPPFILTGRNKNQVWRHQEGDVDRDSESGGEESVRLHSAHTLQIPHLQFTIHSEILPALKTNTCPSGFTNLSEAMTFESSYRITSSPTLCSSILIRSASLEEIPLTRHDMLKELKATEAMMDLHHPSHEVIDDLDDGIIHHWRTSNDMETDIGSLMESRASEAESSLVSLQSAEQVLNHLICESQLSEGKGQSRAELHGWTGGIPDEVLKGERTEL